MPFRVICTMIAVVTGVLFLLVGSFVESHDKFMKISKVIIGTGIVLILLFIGIRVFLF